MSISRNNRGASFLEIIITIAATMIIVGLVFLYYYYSTKPLEISETVAPETEGALIPETPEEEPESENQPIPEQNKMITNVVHYLPPENPNFSEKQGYCLGSSLSYPYREDIFRCKAGSITYDTCFAAENAEEAVCSINPLKEKGVLIKLTEPLPKLSLPENIPDNSAWFVELEDGKFCAPFTGVLPTAGSETAYYNCFSSQKNQLNVLLGQLEKGEIWWTGQWAVLIKSGNNWSAQSIEKVNIKTVWQ